VIEPLRVLIALQYYTPHRTGLTLHVQRLAESLAQRGHDVTVVAARHDTQFPRDNVDQGVHVRRLWAPIRVSRGMIMPFQPAVMWSEIRTADIVSIHTPMLETASIAALCRLANVPLVITHHGDLVLPPSRSGRIIENMVQAGHHWGARRADRVIAYSDDYRQVSTYLKGHSDKTEVITPPISIPVPRPERVAELRAAWSTSPVIGFIGRFVQEKRPDVMLRAMDHVRLTYPEAKLVFAGEYDISYEDTWQNLTELIEAHSDHVEFLGMIDDPGDLADIYGACDVVALPSETECFGLVQVESMLCGTPVVASDIDGARVPVTATGMGRLAACGDPVALATALTDVIARRDSYVRSRDHIVDSLHLDQTIDRYEQVFSDVTKS